MGWAERAKNRAIAGTVCYLCGKAIDPEFEKWNRDHVPPKRIFASSVRKQFNPNLQRLPTHAACNTEAEKDEAYFVVSFAGHLDSDVAQEVMKDIRTKAQKGEELLLIQDVINRFGKVTGQNGEVLFSYDPNRVNRFIWKVVRGLYNLDLGGVLPRTPPSGIELINPKKTPEELEQITWFPFVRNTEPMGRYGKVFDYKWVGWIGGQGVRGHAFAMLFWDQLLAILMFHDPLCACGKCDEWKLS